MESLEGSEEVEDQSFRLTSKFKKKFVKSSVNIHDRNQLETAFDYKILDSLSKKKNYSRFSRSKYKLKVEVFLFFPPGMGISPQTYNKQQFYEDLNPHIRLKEPRLSYKELLGLKNPSDSPLKKVDSLLKKTEPHKHTAAGIESARVFACSFSAYYLKRIQRRCRKLEKSVRIYEKSNDHLSKVEANILVCESHLNESLHVLKEWRLLYQNAKEISGLEEISQEILFALEYSHYRFREGLAKLIHAVDDLSPALPADSFKQLRKRLLVWVRLQRIYASSFGFLWLDEKASETEREEYFSKLNSLKKRMWQPLYLEVKPRKSFLLRKQLAYMLAAGFAAIWALLADFWIRFKLPVSNNLGEGLSDFLELSGLLVIIAFVFAYVLKDRIKETARTKFHKGILGTNPDYSEQILWKDSNARVHNLGIIQEWMSFIDSENLLPNEVDQLRVMHRKKRLFGGEQVVCYRKTIELHPSALKNVSFATLSLRDIIRINVKRYIARLGDPVSPYLSLSEKHGSVVLPMPKSYYLDMVLRYSYKNHWKNFESLALDFNRLVLNKDGLVRIEKI
ncbi:MAG: hypothetical protein AB8G05_01900 [Oligoflexales bacterium]